MKTVAKINPDLEYENAKKIIDLIATQNLNSEQIGSLDASVANLISATRILMEREEKRRGIAHPPKKNELKDKGRQKGEDRKEVNKLPSLRFPDAEIIDQVIQIDPVPSCPCCNKQMSESGLSITNEKLDVIPKKYIINRTKRVLYNCSSCHGSMINTPPLPSIVPSSNYGDSLIIDVALSKFLDLIPIERYAQIAVESGLNGVLPPQSLIGLTHHLANFLYPIYEKIKQEVLSAQVLHADETPHRMLEGDETKNWYLWGFFCFKGVFFEAHPSRSGDIPLENLKNSKAEFLITDGFSGYKKALKDLVKIHNIKINEINCNAHAYRYFKDASITWKEECEIFQKLYGEVYELEEIIKNSSIEKQIELRLKMLPLFNQIKENCERQKDLEMPGGQLQIAMKYFLNHFEGLTACAKNYLIPLDNNLAEREFRGPVIGRKTWFGTHSKRGGITTAVLFSIIRSCKLVNINPRNYFPWVVNEIHNGREILTPYEYSLSSVVTQ